MMKRDILLERDYPYPPEIVWNGIANAEALSQWLMPNDFQPYVGHHFSFRTAAQFAFDGIVRCEVLAIEKPHKLVYTWQANVMKQPTTVIWTLEPIETGTRLRLEHQGFEGLVGLSLSYLLGSGWAGLLKQNLADYLDKIGE